MSNKEMSRREFLAKSAAGAATIALTSAVGFAPIRAFGANDKIRIGLIGTGGRMGSHMGDIHNFSKDMNLEIVAVCDTWRLNRERAAAKIKEWYGVEPKQFTDYHDLLAMKDVDAVVIASADLGHSRQLIDAVRSGKDVYCEKPMSMEVAEANAALDTVKASDRIVQIGTQRRSDGKWKAVAKMMQTGLLGTVSRVEIALNDNNPRWTKKVDDCKAEDVDWQLFLMGRKNRPFDPHQYREWQKYRDYSMGPIGLLGTHYLDVVAWVMNDPYPASAVMHGGHYIWKDNREHEDTLYALFDFPKGFMCRYLTGLGNTAQEGVQIYGTNGMFSEATWSFTGTGGKGDNKIKDEIKVEAEPSENHMQNWLECLRSRKQPNAPIQVGHQHAVASIMGYKALRSGRKMTYDPATRKLVEA